MWTLNSHGWCGFWQCFVDRRVYFFVYFLLVKTDWRDLNGYWRPPEVVLQKAKGGNNSDISIKATSCAISPATCCTTALLLPGSREPSTPSLPSSSSKLLWSRTSPWGRPSSLSQNRTVNHLSCFPTGPTTRTCVRLPVAFTLLALSCLRSPSEELTSEPCDLQVTSAPPSLLPLSQQRSPGHETGTLSVGPHLLFQNNCSFSSNPATTVTLS